MAAKMDVLLFPLLNVTLFPRTTKPINIFETKDINLIKASQLTNMPIALAFIDDPALTADLKVGERPQFVRSVCGYGYSQIVEERLNGTMLVFITGIGKVKLGKLKSSSPHLICEAEEIIENNEVEPEVFNKVSALNKILANWILKHIPDPYQRDVFLKSLTGPLEIIGAFSAYMIREYDLQQEVLEIDDINKKIDFLYRLAESNELTSQFQLSSNQRKDPQ